MTSESASAGEPVGAAPDLDALVAEIEAEAEAKLESGELDPEFLHELDMLFDRLVPRGGDEGDFWAALERAEREALIDLNAPTESTHPAFVPVKRTVRKLILWYMEYLAGQMTAFAGSSSRATRLLGDQVKELEQRIRRFEREHRESIEQDEASRLRVLEVARELAVDTWPAWTDEIVAGFDSVDGRVLHADCGSGALLRELVAAGVDAYGTDPSERLTVEAVAGGLDARPDHVVTHLRRVTPRGLGGAVLSGCVDRHPVADLVEIAELLGRNLAPGGRVALVGVVPDRSGAVDAGEDLAPGRPLRAETWHRLLDRSGFADIETRDGADGTFVVWGHRSP